MWKALIKLVEKWGCNHDYQLEHDHRVSSEYGGTYTIYTYKCSKCGKFKKLKSS